MRLDSSVNPQPIQFALISQNKILLSNHYLMVNKHFVEFSEAAQVKFYKLI